MKKFKLLIILFLFFTFSACVFANDTFEEYAKTLRKDINTAWKCDVYTRKPAEVYFKVNQNGQISDIKILNSSDNTKFDITAKNSIKEIMMYNPLPKGYNSDFIEVIATFTNQKSTNINLNHNVKIKKMIFRTNFLGDSNFKPQMKKLEPNIYIQKALNK